MQHMLDNVDNYEDFDRVVTGL